MSGEAREWVWEHSASRGAARLVLLSIADRVPDDQCVAWASMGSLMNRTRASRNAIRSAVAALGESGELEVLKEYDGPQRSTVYRLPLAAAWLAKVAAAREDDPDAYVEPLSDADPVPELNAGPLRKHGIWPKEGAVADPSGQVLPGAVTDPSRRNPTPQGGSHRPPVGAATTPQNRREPKVNRRSSSRAAALTSAANWRIDDASLSWAQQQGHLARLGEHGIQAADAKWRHHRATWSPRSAAAWAADWRAWIAREHSPAPQRPSLYAVPGGTAAPPSGITRADAHMAALLAAVNEPTGTE